MSFNRYLSTGLLPPSTQGGIYLPPMFSIIEPLERTNRILNPSFETNSLSWTGFGASGISRDTSDRFKGAACLQVIPSSTGTDGVFQNITFEAGTYAISAYFKATNIGGRGVGRRYRIAIYNGATLIVSYVFVGTDYWQRVWVPFTTTSPVSRSVVINKVDHDSTVRFLIDAVQVEKCEDGAVFPTTYIDGDQQPLVLRQSPPPYFWTSGPDSSSVRLATTNAGGRIVRLDRIGFQLLGVEGLSASFPDLQSVEYAELDGGELQRIRKQSRTFSLVGRLDADAFRRARSQFGRLVSILDRDFSPVEQPVKLIFTPMDENDRTIGESAAGYEIVCVYEGGLEGDINNFNTDVVTIQFRMFEPTIQSVQEYASVEFTESQSFAINYMASRDRSGSWSSVNGGFITGANVTTIVQHPANGLIFVGGGFTSIGLSGADFCAIYNPTTDTWSNVNGSDTTFNGAVEAIVIGPDGNVYIAGTFTNAGGIAEADGICRVSATGGSLAALGTGITAGANSCVALAAVDNFIYAGGTFSTMGGVANTSQIARWNITTSTWQAVGTGVTGGTTVNDIAGFGDFVYAVGNFTAMSGVANTTRVARFNSATGAWTALSTGVDSEAFAVAVDRNTGDVYIGGQFTTAGGQAINRIVKWDGYTFSSLGPAGASFGLTSGSVRGLHFDNAGRLWIVGSLTEFDFGDTNMATVPGVIIWTGSTMVNAPLSNVAGNSGCWAIEITPGDVVYLGFIIADDLEVATQVVCTNPGNARTFPIFKFRSSAASSVANILSLENLTTKKAIYNKYTIQQNERWTFNFDPRRKRLWSEYSGNIAGTLWPGSQFAQMYLVPGDNTIEFLTDGQLTGTGFLYWKAAYNSIDAIWPASLGGL